MASFLEEFLVHLKGQEEIGSQEEAAPQPQRKYMGSFRTGSSEQALVIGEGFLEELLGLEGEREGERKINSTGNCMCKDAEVGIWGI